MEKKLRLALIGGAGKHAQKKHHPTIRTNSDVTLRAMADLNIPVLEEIRDKWYRDENIIIESDYRELLHRKDIDAVIASLPSKLHCEVITESVKAGKHILCEKPLAMTREEGNAILEVIKPRPFLVVQIVHQLLHEEAAQEIRKILWDGEHGEIRLIQIDRSLDEPKVGAAEHEQGMLRYFEQGGVPRIVNDHDIDLVLYWTAGLLEPVSVTAFGAKTWDRLPSPNHITSIIQFDTGAFWTSQIGWLTEEKASFEQPRPFTIRLFTDQCTIHYSRYEGKVDIRSSVIPSAVKTFPVSGFERQLKAFVGAVRRHIPLTVGNPHDAYRTLFLTHTIKDALEYGKTVSVKLPKSNYFFPW